ncbi:merozoite surface protein 10, putative [Plasmodium relictum]|uniref:Merozoite surface protein 10, putative n=1 Tax=Plasmodium relictum TaxID=85471 RepID=A0A1J1HBY4_PLARL|nr:merozoite surface protein 10, putative [Plasmodium relictum]CRH00932.1 merozoite surface protein 10, putative [Plasmodium relictum]
MIFLKFIKSFTLVLLFLLYLNNIVYAYKIIMKEETSKNIVNEDHSHEEATFIKASEEEYTSKKEDEANEIDISSEENPTKHLPGNENSETVNEEGNDNISGGETDNSNEVKTTKENEVAFTEDLIKNMMKTRENEQQKTMKDILDNPEDILIIASSANSFFQKGKDLFMTDRDNSETIRNNLKKKNNEVKEAVNYIDEGIYKLEQIIMKVRFYTEVINNFIKFKSNYVCNYSKCGENARCYIVEKNKEECRCRANYIQDTNTDLFTCIPMNEKSCSVNNGYCDKNAECSITDNIIKCQCEDSFFGDGIFCVKNYQMKQSLCIFIIFLICLFQKYFV